MKGSWMILAIGVSLLARPASTEPERPANEEQSSSGSERSDAGQHSSAADSFPGAAYESQGYDSTDVPSSAESSAHDRQSTLPADGESREAAPPRARPRDPDSTVPPPTDAQLRHPRPDDRGPVGGGADFYAYDPVSLPADDGYSPLEYDGRSGYAPDYFRNRSRPGGVVRLVVDPGHTAVYVDGHYAGIAKEFNGTFQALFLAPGYHKITLTLDGYRTHWVRVFMPPDQALDVHHVMERFE
jgi:hypothetical protein